MTILSHKIKSLFPEQTIIKNFFSLQELEFIRGYFNENKLSFVFMEDISIKRSTSCHIKIRKQEVGSFSWIETKIIDSLNKVVLENGISKDIVSRIKFREFYFKRYEEENYYKMHVDYSNFGLSFVTQFSNQPTIEKFNNLIFKNANNIKFEDNQIIIFHSSLEHEYFSKVNSDGSIKCLIAIFPDIQ